MSALPMIKFGSKSANLEQAAEALGAVLNAEFVLHESDFRGGTIPNGTGRGGLIISADEL